MMKLGLIGSAAIALAAASCSADRGAEERVATSEAALESVTSFGSNPGALQMYRYVPAAVPANAPVVVVLHGCTQSAADFVNAGWNPLADKYKFYVVYAQQPSANNPSTCFDWFGKYNTPADKTNIIHAWRRACRPLRLPVSRYRPDVSRLHARRPARHRPAR